MEGGIICFSWFCSALRILPLWFLYRPDRDARSYDDMDNQADPIKRNEQLPTPSFRLMGSLATTREK